MTKQGEIYNVLNERLDTAPRERLYYRLNNRLKEVQ